eukprot:2349152-Alexandrium_andersonii.AAC.1
MEASGSKSDVKFRRTLGTAKRLAKTDHARAKGMAQRFHIETQASPGAVQQLYYALGEGEEEEE